MEPQSRSGLTMIEIVVVLAVLLILAAAALPSLVSKIDRDRVTSAVETLQDITDGMTSMHTTDAVGWPGRISQLSKAVTTSDQSVCWSGTYVSGKVSKWNGPYIDRVVPSTGLGIGIGTILDSVYRTVIAAPDTLLTIEIDNVSEADAIALNRAVDNDGDVAGRTTGTVQWTTPTTEGLVTVKYYRPIRGC